MVVRTAWLLGAALLCSHVTAAEATSLRTRAARTHNVSTRISRIDSLLPTTQVVAPPGVKEEARPLPFAFDLILPFFYNTDPDQSLSGKPSFEVNPEARLTWSQRLEAPVRISALLDVNADQFTRRSDNGANADMILGRLRAQYESGRNDQQWQPFAYWQPNLIFSQFFAQRVDTWNDLGLGVARYLDFGPGLRRVAVAGDTRDAAVVTLGIEISGSRRFRDGGPASFAAFANPSVNWQVTPQWSFAAQADLTYRWFERFLDRERRNQLATPILTLEYQPPDGWLPHPGSGLARALGTPLVDFQVFFSRQHSNIEQARFRQFGLGPMLRTGWRF
jgi:hypothetical protein